MGADIFGLGGAMTREWDQGHASELDAALNRVDVHFEFCQKLGIEYCERRALRCRAMLATLPSPLAAQPHALSPRIVYILRAADCFHDRDVSPEGASVKETEAMFDTVAEKLAAGQKQSGVKLLWGTSNLFSHKRFMHGGPTNPDPAVVCMAAAQV